MFTTQMPTCGRYWQYRITVKRRPWQQLSQVLYSTRILVTDTGPNICILRWIENVHTYLMKGQVKHYVKGCLIMKIALETINAQWNAFYRLALKNWAHSRSTTIRCRHTCEYTNNANTRFISCLSNWFINLKYILPFALITILYSKYFPW